MITGLLNKYIIDIYRKHGTGSECKNSHQLMLRNKFYSILFYSILFYSILFYSVLFCSVLFYFQFYSILFYSILFYSILFYYILFYSIIFYSILFLSKTSDVYYRRATFLKITLLWTRSKKDRLTEFLFFNPLNFNFEFWASKKSCWNSYFINNIGNSKAIIFF